MPTTHPRIQVTVTPEVAQALAFAQTQWPDAAKSELVTRLVLMGQQNLESQRANDRARRLQAVTETAGTLPGAYGPDYLDQLRSDWPQ